ncbi:regulatory protein BlaR1 [Clostridium saccharobutylicum]|uniref:Regulatory protein BlaR1 n=2 Tax=Clostridium saccharobutylicum TaxID=169679 RepID=U5MYY8_CLOSA|nr:M56 family metallopeptidase [Clostridium saccharobutylicum]AGX44722.1 regulatory protein BlaR1 [Clostridium saccharobutylicum DSM 13864]AQR92011.1 regulatory protein BlaR1 [Clostridium saccharobutylicum]AQS01913.1 regulatory protein BlaR1 [Clostridium saccharobutylicum]AQS11513.1 regulatory protein BlaR1 [Clostridium saccharobutylicum]AQS15896.1 regulatory protein BlaR1 [Clostridium saccharobutylicum]
MYAVMSYFDQLFKIIFQTSITTSILIGLILIFRKFTKGKLGVKFNYALWFLILLRLIIFKLPESNFSIFNFLNKLGNMSWLVFNKKIPSGDILQQGISKSSVISNHNVILRSISSMDFSNNDVMTSSLSSITILSFIWLIGVLVTIIYIFLVYKKLRKRIYTKNISNNTEFLTILNQCKNIMQIKKNVLIVETSIIKTPALFGYFKPIILIPKNIQDIISTDKLRYVFFHELSHLKRKDVITNWIITLLKVVYWFNPVVQYGLGKMKEDMEICCDSLALSYTKDEEVKEYGFTIINMIDHFSNSIPLIGTTSIVNNKSEVRRRIIMIKLFDKKAYRFSAMAVASLFIIGGIVLTDAKTARAINSNNNGAVNVDKTDYPFVNDPNIIGEWQGVDFVDNIDDFNVNSKSCEDDLYVKELNFTDDGKVSKTVFTWTKDHILNDVDKTDSSYVIKDIDGSTYMFFQWKSGDYTIRGMEPSYYVLKKVSSTPSLTTNMSGKEVETRADKIDYPFVNDPEVLGKWESVDFVQNMDNFNPDVKSWQGDLYLSDLVFDQNGKIKDKNITWTKDLVINANDKTASKYAIKEINGSKYMFFEWKNGDYIERGETPWYYVLKQVN